MKQVKQKDGGIAFMRDGRCWHVWYADEGDPFSVAEAYANQRWREWQEVLESIAPNPA